MKNEKMALFANLMTVSVVALLGLFLAGCGKSGPNSNGSDTGETASEGASEELTPEERGYVAAAKPFATAIAGRNYDEAYTMLSTHAKARMSLNQFAPEDDDAKFAQNEKNPLTNVTTEKFRELMGRVEQRHGTPQSVRNLSVFSTDVAILNRRGKEQFDAFDSMFAIGNMPDSVPADSRRASLRGQIGTQLSAQDLEKIAKEEGTTVAELQKNPDFQPYCTLKIVLVEETGQMKVGYFEFLPPGIMD